MSTCAECGKEFESKREAKFCSSKCRLANHRKLSVSQNGIKVDETDNYETDNETFKFTIKIGNTDPDKGIYNAPDVIEAKKRVRSAIYWYDVPLAAVPVYQKNWPKMPDYMHGRQYFLWWKNGFKTSEETGPILYNPFPLGEEPKLYLGGENARRWGA